MSKDFLSLAWRCRFESVEEELLGGQQAEEGAGEQDRGGVAEREEQAAEGRRKAAAYANEKDTCHAIG